MNPEPSSARRAVLFELLRQQNRSELIVARLRGAAAPELATGQAALLRVLAAQSLAAPPRRWR